MKKGWYIVIYHDVSWEENLYMKGIGGTFPPDIFRDHLTCLSEHGRLVSVQEGFDRYRQDDISEPLISIWFDDGFCGVRKYAYPILDSFNITAALSVNSQFVLKQELFWRAKLSFIRHTGMLHILRSKLRKLGFTNHLMVKDFVMDHFSEEVVTHIDTVFAQCAPEQIRKDSLRIFDDFTGVRELHNEGWEIANHSASHYPIGESSYIHKFQEEFEKCESVLKDHLGAETNFWVIPFDRKRDPNLYETFAKADSRDRTLVLLGDKVNKNFNQGKRVLHRIMPGLVKGNEVVKKLRRIGNR